MNPLTDVLPPQVRKYLYAVAFVAAIVWGAYEASAGDWRDFTGALISALVAATAASNITKG